MKLNSNFYGNMQEYFNNIALEQTNKKYKNKYYWNEITEYCYYFSHDSYSVLEIGCGTGDLISNLKGYSKTGIDFSEQMINIAKSKYDKIEFLVMDAENLQLNQKFDLIILSNLIGFTNDIQLVFEQLHKVCHSKTKIIVTYYNHLWEPILKFAEFIGIKRKTPVQNWLSHLDIRNLLNLAGFEVYRENKRMLLPIYIPILSSLANKILAKLPLIKNLAINNYSFARALPSIPNHQDHNEYSVSVIIPARNEAGNIEDAIRRMPSFGKSQEIIFVEGNSTDQTWLEINNVKQKYALEKTIHCLKQTTRGKANAVRNGFDIATGDILMILDADLTVPPEDLTKFYNAIASNKGEFINGCRLIYPMEKQAMRFLNMIGNKFFGLAFSWLLDQPFKDTLCGTKVLFKKDYLNLVNNRDYFGDFDPFGDFDLLFGAHKLNLKIVELPIRYKERKYGTTNISRFKHGFILLKMCLFAARKIKFK